MKSKTHFTMFAVTAIALFASVLGRNASADEPETVLVTFGLLIPGNQLPDADGDGVPEMPALTGDSLAGVVFGRAFDANSILSFAGGSQPQYCGDVEVGGTDWLSNAPAMLVGKGAPIVGTSYGGFGPLFPPERRFLQARNVATVDACWVKVNGSDELVVQTAYDDDTIGVFVVFTAEFRLQDVL